MNIYNYKNITVEVTTTNPEWVEMLGDGFMTLDSNFISELIENSCTFSEFFLGFECDHYDEFDSEDEEEAIKYFKNLNEEIEVRNADALIAVYEFALENEDRQFTFKVETQNISWVIHDILHAKHDTAGCTIYVEEEIEKQRIIESLTITKDLFPHEMPDFSFFEELETAFNERFNTYIDLDEFKYSEEELEDY